MNRHGYAYVLVFVHTCLICGLSESQNSYPPLQHEREGSQSSSSAHRYELVRCAYERGQDSNLRTQTRNRSAVLTKLCIPLSLSDGRKKYPEGVTPVPTGSRVSS